MAGARVAQLVGRQIELGICHGRHCRRPGGSSEPVEPLDHRSRPMAGQREAPQRAPELAHRARRFDPVPNHVPDRDPDPIVADPDHVVPIPTDVELLGARPVSRGDGDPWVRRKRTGEETLLQGGGHRMLLLVELCAFESLRAERDDRAERGALTLADRPARGELQRHDADRAPSRVEEGEASGSATVLLAGPFEPRIRTIEALERVEPDLASLPDRVRRGEPQIERQRLERIDQLRVVATPGHGVQLVRPAVQHRGPRGGSADDRAAVLDQDRQDLLRGRDDRQ